MNEQLTTDELDLDEIEALLAPKKPTGPAPRTPPSTLNIGERRELYFQGIINKNNIVKNNAHFKFADREGRCASKGCSGPTHKKVDGISYCHVHAIFRLLEIIDRLERKLEGETQYLVKRGLLRMSGTITVAPSPAKVGDSIVVTGVGFGVYATLSTALTGTNNDITLTAVAPGTPGNSITLVLLDPAGNNAALSVTVSTLAITVHLATGAGGAITSTANLVLAAINASVAASALVVASLKTGNDGTGVVTALGSTPLATGAEASVEVEFLHESDAQDDVRESFATTAGAFSSSALTYRLEDEGALLVNARVSGAVVDSAEVEVFTVAG